MEISLTAYNPVQSEVVDHTWLRRNFDRRLAHYGGISTQTVLPLGAPQDVKRAIAQCMATLAPEGTGMLVAPSHRLMSEIPLDNVNALLEGLASLSEV